MSVASDRTRAAVTRRAGDRCEYCRLPTIGQAATFPLDHVMPRDRGGLTVLENLALAWPTHAARQLPNGRWTSKLGHSEELEHDLRALEGAIYGSVALFMKRPA